MADIQKQLDRIHSIFSDVLEWIILNEIVVHGSIDRDHADVLPGVGQQQGFIAEPVQDTSEILLTQLSDLSQSIHETGHAVITNDSEVVVDNLQKAAFSIGFTRAFS